MAKNRQGLDCQGFNSKPAQNEPNRTTMDIYHEDYLEDQDYCYEQSIYPRHKMVKQEEINVDLPLPLQMERRIQNDGCDVDKMNAPFWEKDLNHTNARSNSIPIAKNQADDHVFSKQQRAVVPNYFYDEPTQHESRRGSR